MKKNVDKYNNSTFENIKYIDDYGNEYWYARELSKVLEYKDWRNFQKVIGKAVLSAKNSISDKEIGLLKSTSQSRLVKEMLKDCPPNKICY